MLGKPHEIRVECTFRRYRFNYWQIPANTSFLATAGNRLSRPGLESGLPVGILAGHDCPSLAIRPRRPPWIPPTPYKPDEAQAQKRQRRRLGDFKSKG